MAVLARLTGIDLRLSNSKDVGESRLAGESRRVGESRLVGDALPVAFRCSDLAICVAVKRGAAIPS